MSLLGAQKPEVKEITMYDVVIVGGSFAGLSAALMLGRARRRVLVLDAGTPRNAPAEHAYSLLSRDGISPFELLCLSREELSVYDSVEFRVGQVAGAVAEEGGFNLTSTDGQQIEARKLILATGVTDVLPEIPGLAELWGRGVYHCPYCHGWEVRDKRWAILGDAPMIFDRVALFRGWASVVVVLANGASSLPPAERQSLVALGAVLDERRIAQVARTGADNVEVSFEDGSSLIVGGLFAMPHQVQRSSLPEALGCEFDDFVPTASRYVKTDPATGETTVQGVYAAGDMIGPQQNLVFASASGALAAIRLNHAMSLEDAEAVVAGASLTAA
jgi:thioredoxin reductase